VNRVASATVTNFTTRASRDLEPGLTGPERARRNEHGSPDNDTDQLFEQLLIYTPLLLDWTPARDLRDRSEGRRSGRSVSDELVCRAVRAERAAAGRCSYLPRTARHPGLALIQALVRDRQLDGHDG
jgi:hypothetical protein